MAVLTQKQMPTYSQAWAIATAPTLSYSTSATVSGGSSITPTDSKIRYSGGATRGIVNQSEGYYRPNYMADISDPTPPFLPMYGVKIKTNSNVVEFALRQRDNLSGNVSTRVPIRIRINGQWTSRFPIYVGPNNIGYDGITPSFVSAGTEFWLKLSFSSAIEREIEIVMMTEFARISVPNNYSFLAASAFVHRAVILGDSLSGGEKHGTGNFSLNSSQGSGHKATYTHVSSFWSYMCQTLGYDNVINMGSGSSGYNDSGDSAKYIAASRLNNDIIACNPELVVVGTAFNDLVASTSAEIGGWAEQVQNTIKAALPNAIRIVLGDPTPPVVTGIMGGTIKVASDNEAMRVAAKNTGAWFIDPQAGDLYNPAGNVVLNRANFMTGNDEYIASDGTHPSQAGADFFGSGIFAEMIKAAHPVGSTTTPDPDDPEEPSPITTTTTLTTSRASGYPTTSITLTASVTASVAGVVQFKNNGNNLGSAVIVSSGKATKQSTFNVGTQNITAVFSPYSSAYLPSTSETKQIVITSTPTVPEVPEEPEQPEVPMESIFKNLAKESTLAQLIAAGTLYSFQTTASTNLRSVRSEASNVYNLTVSNFTGSTVYVKLYNSGSAAVGSTVPVFTLAVASGSSSAENFGTKGIRLPSGISIAVTGAGVSSDETATAAGAQISLTYL